MRATHRLLVSKLERSHDELAATGGAATAMNEELQAINEELQASNSQLSDSQTHLEEMLLALAERTRWLTLLHDVSLAINEAAAWDDALQRVVRLICEAEQWQAGFVYLPDPQNGEVIVPVIRWLAHERLRPFHDACERQPFSRGESLPGRVFGAAQPIWINGQAALLDAMPVRAEQARAASLVSAVGLPIILGHETMAVLELVSDRPHAASADLLELMNDVGRQIGCILKRERAAAELADLAWREQQALLHTLHDSLGQTLTGIGMLSAGLSSRLSGADAAVAQTAAHIAQQAQAALEQVRQLSNGLFPIAIDANGLLPALRRLATTTTAIHGIPVDVESDVDAPLRDGHVVTQLYRIAQEAVTNAVKHAHARRIAIRLTTTGAVSRLQVIDDGIGLQGDTPRRAGLGLQIMRHRAASIGASISISPRVDGGTTVRCILREAPRPSASRMA